MITVTPLSREAVIKELEPGGIAAELGVWNGEFAAAILEQNAPAKLHLVDPWGASDDEYVQTYKIKHDMEDKYQAVCKKFSSNIELGQVEIQRKYSSTFFPTLADGCLDWVYIDGMHTYDGVMADLSVVESKVASDGFILGHDFLAYERKRDSFGVVAAVHDFLASRQYNLIAITLDAAPTYVIAKDPGGKKCADFLQRLVVSDDRVIQFSPDIIPYIRHTRIHLPDGKPHYTLSIDMDRQRFV